MSDNLDTDIKFETSKNVPLIALDRTPEEIRKENYAILIMACPLPITAILYFFQLSWWFLVPLGFCFVIPAYFMFTLRPGYMAHDIAKWFTYVTYGIGILVALFYILQAVFSGPV